MNLPIFTVRLLLLTILLITSEIWKTNGLKVVPPKIQLDILCSMDEGDTAFVRCYPAALSHLKHSSTFVDFKANNTFIFKEDGGSSIIMAGFSCTAPYPVEWAHTQEEWMSSMTDNWFHILRHQILTFKRPYLPKLGRKGLPDDFENTAEFPHSALLRLTNTMSLGAEFSLGIGEYSCQSAAKSKSSIVPNRIARMSVFQKMENNEKVFPLSRKTVTIFANEKDDNGGRIIFPCHVMNPDPNLSIKLFKRVIKNVIFPHVPTKRLGFSHLTVETKPAPNATQSGSNNTVESWEEAILPSEGLRFQAELGFIYEIEGSPSHDLPQGLYKCVAVSKADSKDATGKDDNIDGSDHANAADDNDDAGESDFVLINLKYEKKPQTSPEQFISPKALLNSTIVDKKKKHFNVKCCSNSATPPDLYLASCFSRSMCEKYEKGLSRLGTNALGANRLTTAKGNCRTSFNISYVWAMPLSTRCIGDGVDTAKTFILPMEGDKSYDDWDDVDPSTMISMTLEEPRLNATNTTTFEVFKGQNLTFRCTTSIAYFAIGAQFKLNFVNGTSIGIKGEKVGQLEDSLIIGISPKITKVMASKDIDSISCFAPVINSQQWIEKSVQLEVHDSDEAIITNFADEELFWILGERNKQLVCEFDGAPLPKTVEWMKDNITILHTINSSLVSPYNYSMPGKNVSILEVDVANYETHGEYTCHVSNIFGSDRRTVKVYVRPSEESWTILSSLLGMGCIVVVAVLLGYQTWRQRQKLKAHGITESHPNGRGGFIRF